MVIDDTFNELEKNKGCTPWKISEGNDYIKSSNTNKTEVILFSNFVMNFNLRKKGKVIYFLLIILLLLFYNFLVFPIYFFIIIRYLLNIEKTRKL